MQSTSPWLIVGLGNPGAKYEKTWHNAGFLSIEYIAQKHKIKLDRIKFKGVYGQGVINGEKVILLKPSTFMNNSGECVQEAVSFFKIPPDKLILIYDDIDVERGVIKIRPNGSAGTHNGMRSVISHLNWQDFPRLRVGIGPLPERWAIVDYVLSEISSDYQAAMFDSFKKAGEALEAMIAKGIAPAMNLFNGKEKPAKKDNSTSNSTTAKNTTSNTNEKSQDF